PTAFPHPPRRPGRRRADGLRHLAPDPEAPAQADHRGHTQARAARRLAAHAAATAASSLAAAERFPDDPVLLPQVRRRVALARARAPRAADVAERRRLRQGLLEPV